MKVGVAKEMDIELKFTFFSPTGSIGYRIFVVKFRNCFRLPAPLGRLLALPPFVSGGERGWGGEGRSAGALTYLVRMRR